MCVKQDTREHEHNIHLVVCDRAVSPTSNNTPRTVMHVQLHNLIIYSDTQTHLLAYFVYLLVHV